MLNPRVLKSAAQAAVYFELDDYYVAGQQLAPSSWWGKGAERFELRGEVDRATFADLLHGRLPNGDALRKGGRGIHRPGVDLTFSAPKSVSIMALVAGEERILKAHDRAVTAALEYLERTAPRARVRQNGAIRIETSDNLLVARFNHDSSRALDPQLHTHAVVLNVTQRKDGAWKALSNEELFRSVKAGGAIYRAELANELRRLGYAIERTHADGRFELGGVATEWIEAFSQRRAQIVEHMERRGLQGPVAAAEVARATREAKKDTRRYMLQAEWQNRATAIRAELRIPRKRTHQPEPGRDRQAAEDALSHAVEHFSERRVIISERQLLQVALGFGIGRTTLEDVERAIARRIERDELVPAASSRQKDPFTTHYTTDRALLVEQDLIHLMTKSRASVPPIAAPGQVEAAIREVHEQSPFPITEGQERAIRLAVSTTDSLAGIQGYAGTGKTTGSLLHIRRIAEAAGYEVLGFAPSAAATEVLSRDAGIQSMTLAKLLKMARSPGGAKPQLWIVDEVSMMGNDAAHQLLLRAKQAGARVLWVGDRDQLPSIEAGRAFGLLMDHGLSFVTIETIVRQRDPILRQAVERTIVREHERAMELLRPRVLSIPDRAARLHAVATSFLELSRDEQKSTLVITPSNADRHELNELIRKGLRERGVLGRQLDTRILIGRDLTRAETTDAAHFREGDVVRFNRSYKRLGISQDDYLQVLRVEAAKNMILLRDADGRDVVWKPKRYFAVEVYESERRALAPGDVIRWTRNDGPRGRFNAELAEVLEVDPRAHRARVSVHGREQILDLIRDRHWEHAYVSTVHAAQGRTADRLLLHLDTSQQQLMGHESWYVGISRARRDIQLFVDDANQLPALIRTPLEQDSALEVARTPQDARDVSRDQHHRHARSR